MEREHRNTANAAASALPKIEVPPHVPATAAEIARRRALALEVDRQRESMPVTARNAADIVRQDRDEHEEEHG